MANERDIEIGRINDLVIAHKLSLPEALREAMQWEREHGATVPPSRPDINDPETWREIGDTYDAVPPSEPAVESTSQLDIFNLVCRDLPEHYWIEVHLEKDSGYVTLYRLIRDGEIVVANEDKRNLEADIHEAIRIAKEGTL